MRFLTLITILLLSSQSWAQSNGGIPAMPDCSKMKTAAERSRALNEYVDRLEAMVEKDHKLTEKDEYKTLIALVSAQLLPDTTPFRTLDLECWAHFEEARRELKDAKPLRATQAGERWQRCLIAKEDELLAAATPLLKCLNVQAEK
ncbi:MAG: hypothetical protein JNJ49_12555 [Bdellovibrionaceae bacterium]|nr:hypothetical protein [Pseudobdellovibrionaceae bacterium]